MTDSAAAVVIIGGGPAGCAAAISLRARGIGTVVVVEAGAYEGDRIGESVPPDTRLVLGELGLLEAFDRQGHDPCQGSQSSWGDDALGYNDFVLNPNGAGVHLDRRRFDVFMARHALEAGAQLLTRTRFRRARPRRSWDVAAGFELELESAGGVRRVATSYVIDATGSSARFARGRGAQRIMHDYMFCATGTFHLREGAQLSQLTLLEATPDGWWYAARLPDRRVAVALACDRAELRSKELHHSAGWLEQLSRTRHLAAVLRECFLVPDSLRVCPIPCFVLDRPAGEAWLAVGDAATAFDPLSARGIHKALTTGLRAAHAIEASVGGQSHAIADYAAGVGEDFDAYVEQRNHFYQREQRWSGRTFWRRRNSA